MIYSQWGKIFKDLSDDVDTKCGVLENGVSQIKQNISQIDTRLKSVEQAIIFKDHEAFQTAVNLQIEKFSSSIKLDFQTAVDKQTKFVSGDIKADMCDNYKRRNRNVIFGIYDTSNDV